MAAASLPQLSLTTGGLVTALHYTTPYNLRSEATFETLFDPSAGLLVDSILTPFLSVAIKYRLPIYLHTETWRASRNWFDLLKTPDEDRTRVYRLAEKRVRELARRIELATDGGVKAYILGCIGPMQDAYRPSSYVSVEEAATYHSEQLLAMKEAGITMTYAATMTSSKEAAAIASESAKIGLPSIISFTLEQDGNLPSSESLGDAINAVDSAAVPRPAWYEVNCSHPRILKKVLKEGVKNGELWVQRLKGIRANASSKSHDELNEGGSGLDRGDVKEWAKEVVELREVSAHVVIFGGCCGTDAEHCEEIAKLLKDNL